MAERPDPLAQKSGVDDSDDAPKKKMFGAHEEEEDVETLSQSPSVVVFRVSFLVFEVWW